MKACATLGLSDNNSNFIDFLASDFGSQILRKNMLSIHIETGNIFFDNYNTNESLYKVLVRQKDETKKIIHATLSYEDSFSNYIKHFLDDVDPETVDKFDFFTNKNAKYLFYRFNNLLLYNNQYTIPMRHSKVAENDVVMKEVQNRDCQYLIESVTTFVEHDKSTLRPISKCEKKIIKNMKHNYKVACRVYNSIYSNIAEQFKIYLEFLASDKIDETENYFRANGNGLFSFRDSQSTTELFHSFAMFYYINGRLPYTTGHLFVPDREIPQASRGKN